MAGFENLMGFFIHEGHIVMNSNRQLTIDVPIDELYRYENEGEEEYEDDGEDNHYDYDEKMGEISVNISNEKYVNIEEIKEKGFDCPICQDVISGTVAITTCLHKFCSKCLFNHCKNKVNPNCPMCRKDLDVNDIILSDDITEYLDNSLIICKNIECKELMKRKEYKTHDCKYDKSQCKFCGVVFYKEKYNEHVQTCDMKTVKCNLCRCFVIEKLMEHHRKHKCPRAIVECKYQCNYRSQRYKIDFHHKNCHRRIVQCPNSCDLCMEYKDLENHNEICLNRDVSLDKK